MRNCGKTISKFIATNNNDEKNNFASMPRFECIKNDGATERIGGQSRGESR